MDLFPPQSRNNQNKKFEIKPDLKHICKLLGFGEIDENKAKEKLKELFQDKQTIVLANDDSIRCMNAWVLRSALYKLYEMLELEVPNIQMPLSVFNGSGFGGTITKDFLDQYQGDKNQLQCVVEEKQADKWNNLMYGGHKTTEEFYGSVQEYKGEEIKYNVNNNETSVDLSKVNQYIDSGALCTPENKKYDGVKWYKGYPCDAIDIIANDKSIKKVDLVIGGPNDGGNIGINQHKYSGTCNIGNRACLVGGKFDGGVKIALSEEEGNFNPENNQEQTNNFVNNHLASIAKSLQVARLNPNIVNTNVFSFNTARNKTEVNLNFSGEDNSNNEILIFKKPNNLELGQNNYPKFCGCTTEFKHLDNNGLQSLNGYNDEFKSRVNIDDKPKYKRYLPQLCAEYAMFVVGISVCAVSFAFTKSLNNHLKSDFGALILGLGCLMGFLLFSIGFGMWGRQNYESNIKNKLLKTDNINRLEEIAVKIGFLDLGCLSIER